MKKRKIGILLVLIGIGIPLVLFFFQDDGYIYFGDFRYKEIERKLTPGEIKALEDIKRNRMTFSPSAIEQEELLEKYRREFMGEDYYKKEIWSIRSKSRFEIPYQYSIGIGIFLILFGIGMIIFSSSPKTPKLKNDRD